jgi:hypothetical protein
MNWIPLLFTAEMVRSLLDGRKTQTRRIRFKGRAGDGIWVRETFAVIGGGEVIYRATEGRSLCDLKWKSPIFMPRHLSRITLAITSVRTEALQEITEEDARSEGVQGVAFGDEAPYRTTYAELWNKINGKTAPWSSNPAVHVVTFKVAA